MGRILYLTAIGIAGTVTPALATTFNPDYLKVRTYSNCDLYGDTLPDYPAQYVQYQYDNEVILKKSETSTGANAAASASLNCGAPNMETASDVTLDRVKLKADARNQEFGTGNLIQTWAETTDGVIATPEDASLLGQTGRLGVTFEVDGTLQGSSIFDFSASQEALNDHNLFTRTINYSPEVLYSLSATDGIDTLDLDGSGFSPTLYTTGSTLTATYGINGVFDTLTSSLGDDAVFSFTGSVTVMLDVVFGEEAWFQTVFGAAADTGRAGSLADFYNTATLSSFTLLDQDESVVDARFRRASGIDLVVSDPTDGTGSSGEINVVPLPASAVSLLACIGIFAGFRRPRRGEA